MEIGSFPDLSENHRRAIVATLTMLDQALREIEAWAKGREVRSVLHEEHNTLAAAQRWKIRTEIRLLQERLRELAAILDLAPRIVMAQDAVGAELFRM